MQPTPSPAETALLLQGARRRRKVALAVSGGVLLSYCLFVLAVGYFPALLATPLNASGSLTIGVVLVPALVVAYVLVAAGYAAWANRQDAGAIRPGAGH